MFVTKRYIYTPEKRKNEVEISGIKFNPFLFDFENPKSFYKDAYFFDYDFSFLGEFLYFDESIANINGKIIEHNLLMPEKRKEFFNDIKPLENFFKKYLKKGMVVISFENLNELGIKTITPLDAINLKEKLNTVLIKNNGKWVNIETLSNKFVYGRKFYLKIDKIKTFDGIDGVCKFCFKRDKNILNIKLQNKKIKINLLDLLKV
jgi:hypothetical protein